MIYNITHIKEALNNNFLYMKTQKQTIIKYKQYK